MIQKIIAIMKKKHFFTLLFFICFVVTACIHNDKIPYAKQISIDFDSNESSKFSLSQVFGHVYYIPLDSLCPIGQIDGIKIFDNNIYVCNKNEGAVHIFDVNGKYIASIRNRGRAKNEYIELCDFDVSPVNGDIHIYDSGSKRFLVYSKEGTYIRYFHTDDVIRDFSILSNGDYLMYTPDENGDARRGLWQTDSMGNFRRQLVEIDKNFQYGGIYPQYLTRIDSRNIGLMGGEDNNNFYVITEDSATIQLHVDYKISIPSKLQKERNVEFGKHKGEVYTKNNYFESHRWLWFYTTNFEKGILCFYDKVNDICYKIKGEENLTEDVKLLGTPQFIFDDKMIDVIYCSEIQSSNTLRERFPDVTDTSNPILEIVEITQ